VHPVVVTIAGSDSSGGAGIQADLKAIAANGGYPATVVTAVTAQNTTAVRSVAEVSLGVIADQIDAVFDDLEVRAVKTGMLPSRGVVELVADRLRARGPARLVCDPVMVSTSGSTLQVPGALEAVVEQILPLAALITPNADEAGKLAGMSVESSADAEEAGRRIRGLGARAVLVKGGHLAGDRATDVLVSGDGVRRFDAPRIEAPHTHGGGCTYASAIATRLAHGESLELAVERAKEFVTRALSAGLAIGAGSGAVDSFFFLRARGSAPWRRETPRAVRGKR
jgi:hydroxymethylpyrimidine/phosphomethylpyrimidine kinase